MAKPCLTCGTPTPRGSYCPTHAPTKAPARNRNLHRHRQLLLQRDGNVCWICSTPINMFLAGNHPNGPTIDHLIPLSHGGSDHPNNLRLAHHHCNSRRQNR